jgi:hypothetical protein
MGTCCEKPITRIITIGGIEVGIRGLDEIFRDTHVTNENDEHKLKEVLLSKVKVYGNYVSPGREEAYKEDLLREYRKFCLVVKEAQRDQECEMASTRRRWFPWKRGE